MAGYDYATTYSPPAPIIPIRIASPGEVPGVQVMALVDSGADVSVVPEAIALSIELPVVGRMLVRSPSGEVHRHPLHAAEIRIEGETELCEVLALGDEALLGRDVLQSWIVTMHGPRQTLEIARP